MANPPDAIKEALIGAGLRSSETVLVHTGLRAIMDAGDCDYWDDAAELLLSCLLDVVGERGTVLVPTFTYSFCTGEPFDHATTPSEVGPFTNYVLEHPDAWRSFHPIFSFAGVGVMGLPVLRGVPPTSFGYGSVFHRLHQMNALMLFVGCHFACTFVHFVEQSIGVTYRYLKEFTGEVSYLGHTWQGTFDYYVRNLDLGLTHNFRGLELQLFDAGKLRSAELPGGHEVLGVRCRDVYDVIVERLPGDPLFLTKPEVKG